MRILLITDEIWNDKIHGNNVLSNWFTGFSAEFAQIYCSPGNPDNSCCERYFQITDKMMLNSILKHIKAGKVVSEISETKNYVSTDINNLGFLRKHCGNILRFFKNIVWSLGTYEESEMKKFIEDFNPDLIFSPRMATPKLLRLERIVKKYTDCPMVAFTGDNEYSLRMFSFSPVAWINKFWLRKELRRNMKLYSLYYTLSEEQKIEYEHNFNIPIKILRKCSTIEEKNVSNELSFPIRMVYAGKLYCNRWKTLSQIGKAINKINEEETKIILDIYTKDTLTKKQRKALDFGGSVNIHGPITPEQVMEEYSKSDIALHIESFDLNYRLATRVSFSTKIIDCLAGGSAVMAIAWKEHSGLTYLKSQDAAICIESLTDIERVLTELIENPKKIAEYRLKAYNCLKENHNREQVQIELYNDFLRVIESI